MGQSPNPRPMHHHHRFLRRSPSPGRGGRTDVLKCLHGLCSVDVAEALHIDVCRRQLCSWRATRFLNFAISSDNLAILDSTAAHQQPFLVALPMLLGFICIFILFICLFTLLGFICSCHLCHLCHGPLHPHTRKANQQQGRAVGRAPRNPPPQHTETVAHLL